MVTQQASHRPTKRQSRPFGHKEIRRPTGHIMVTTRYSDQQGSKSRQNPCQVQPNENIGNLSARRCQYFRIWIASSREDCLMCCPSNKVIKSDTRSFLPLGGLHDDKLCDTLQAMAQTNVKTVHPTSLLHIQNLYGAYSQDSSRFPRRRPFIYLDRHIRHRVSPELIGSRNCVPMAFTAKSPPAQGRQVVLKVVPVTGVAILQATMDQSMCASLFRHPLLLVY